MLALVKPWPFLRQGREPSSRAQAILEGCNKISGGEVLDLGAATAGLRLWRGQQSSCSASESVLASVKSPRDKI